MHKIYVVCRFFVLTAPFGSGKIVTIKVIVSRNEMCNNILGGRTKIWLPKLFLCAQNVALICQFTIHAHRFVWWEQFQCDFGVGNLAPARYRYQSKKHAMKQGKIPSENFLIEILCIVIILPQIRFMWVHCFYSISFNFPIFAPIFGGRVGIPTYNFGIAHLLAKDFKKN